MGSSQSERAERKRSQQLTVKDILPTLDLKVAEKWDKFVKAATFVLARPKTPVTSEDGSTGFRITMTREDGEPNVLVGAKLDLYPSEGKIVYSYQEDKFTIGNIDRAGIVEKDSSFFVVSKNPEYTEGMQITVGGGCTYRREPINPADNENRRRKGVMVRGGGKRAGYQLSAPDELVLKTEEQEDINAINFTNLLAGKDPHI